MCARLASRKAASSHHLNVNADLQVEFQSKIEEIHSALRPEALELEPFCLRPKKTDITVEKVVLAWMPYLVGADGKLEPAY